MNPNQEKTIKTHLNFRIQQTLFFTEKKSVTSAELNNQFRCECQLINMVLN